MEIVTSEQYVMEAMSATEFFAEDSRPSGAHVSDITHNMDKVLYPAKYSKRQGVEYKGRELEQIQDWTEVGFLWENILQREFRHRMLGRRRRDNPALVDGLHLQESLYKSGVHLTPDGVDTSSVPIWLEEYKATRKSIRKWEEYEKNFWEWIARVKAYCHVLGINHCRFFVYWICGDWAGSGPQTWRYDMVFTDAELKQNWKQILVHASEMGILPSIEQLRKERGNK